MGFNKCNYIIILLISSLKLSISSSNNGQLSIALTANNHHLTLSAHCRFLPSGQAKATVSKRTNMQHSAHMGQNISN